MGSISGGEERSSCMDGEGIMKLSQFLKNRIIIFAKIYGKSAVLLLSFIVNVILRSSCGPPPPSTGNTQELRAQFQNVLCSINHTSITCK